MGILKIKNFKASAMFLDNSRKVVEQMSGYNSFLPENINQVSNELFSLEGVYVCDSPSLNGKATRTERSMSDTDIIKCVKRYLDMGAEIYMYTYYGLRQDFGKPEPSLTNTYWWRFVAIKK